MSISSRILGLVTILVLSACGGTEQVEEPVLATLDGLLSAPECGNGFEIENAQAELRNQRNELIGTATTSGNLAHPFDTCVVSFSIPDVPSTRFYQVEIGTHDGPSWSRQELEAQGFEVALNLGDAPSPSRDASGLCGHARNLNVALHNTELLNERLFRWQAELTSALSDLEADGIALLLSGEQSDGTDLHEVIENVKPMTTALGFSFTLGFMNRHVGSANELMPALTSDCSEVWQEVEYLEA